MTDKEKDMENEAEKEVEEATSEESQETEAGDEKEAETSEEAPETAEEKSEQPEEPKEDGDARYMRLAADFQNYKRRTEKEKSDIYQYANEKIALDIIEVMDNFERAIAHSADCADKQFAEGVEMIYKQLKGVLDKNNIIVIEAEGHEFDPNFHNAVMVEDNPDYESGIVIQAMQKGYTLNGKVIRSSMVKVAQ